MNRSIRYRAIALCGVAASLLAHSVAYSHHGTAGRYEDELMEISGTVISLMFINPHAMLAVEAEDENGNTVRWMAEYNNPPLMAREGWHKGTLKPGDRVGDTWAQSAYIKPSNPEVDALFGYSVAIDANGSRIAVGAYDEDGSLASTNEFQDGLIRGAGAVYVFDFDGDTWHQIEYLKPSNSERGDSFGVAVTISDDGKTVIATARDEDGPTSGINNIPGPDREDSTHPTTGAVYAFVQGDGGSWMQQAYVKASNTGSTDIFGSRLAVSGDGNVLVVGAQFEDSGAKGVGADQSDNSVPDSGAVYLFRR